MISFLKKFWFDYTRTMRIGVKWTWGLITFPVVVLLLPVGLVFTLLLWFLTWVSLPISRLFRWLFLKD